LAVRFATSCSVLPVQDRDYVVVGAPPREMLARGFKPVGKDFPVFLHPHSHAEYALARTERKTGHGYHGFAFDCGPDGHAERGSGAPRPDHQRHRARCRRIR
jgi:hypothetical protein